MPFGDEVHRNHPHHNQPNRTTLTHTRPSRSISATFAAGARDNDDELPIELNAGAHTPGGERHSTHPPPLRRSGGRAPQHGPTQSLYTASLAALPHTGSYSPKAAAACSSDPPKATTPHTATATTDAIAFDTFFHELSSSNTRHHRTTPHPTTFAPTHSPHPITDNNGSSAATCAKEHIPEHTGSKHTSANSQRQDQTRHTSTAAAATQRSLLEHQLVFSKQPTPLPIQLMRQHKLSWLALTETHSINL